MRICTIIFGHVSTIYLVLQFLVTYRSVGYYNKYLVISYFVIFHQTSELGLNVFSKSMLWPRW